MSLRWVLSLFFERISVMGFLATVSTITTYFLKALIVFGISCGISYAIIAAPNDDGSSARDRRPPRNPSRPPREGTKPAPPAPPVLTPAKQLYQLVGSNEIWTKAGALSPRAIQLKKTIARAEEHGLAPAVYWTSQIESLLGDLQKPGIAPNDPRLAQLEQIATDVFLKYATHLSVGRVNPQAVGDEIKVNKKSLNLELLASLLKNEAVELQESMEAVAPQWQVYKNLKVVLKRLTAPEFRALFVEIKMPSKNIKLGEQNNQTVLAMKSRLKALGYFSGVVDANYDEASKEAFKAFAADSGFSFNSEISKSSPILEHLGVALEKRIQQVQLTMEKVRWIPNNPENSHIFVNLSFQDFQLYEDGQRKLSMKTINGRPSRPTPMLKDRLTIVELNPSWTVPPSIIIKDKLKQIEQDPDYLKRNNFIIVDGQGNDVGDWWGNENDLIESDKYYLRQLPGTGNALGVMKFHLTNPYAIYLHDTNERHLFGEKGRSLSSGCVRLEKPIELATYLLKGHPKFGDEQTIKSHLATTRLAAPNIQRELKVTLAQAMPVYLMYFTADLGDDQKIRFAPDRYMQDLRLFELLTFGKVITPSPDQAEKKEVERRKRGEWDSNEMSDRSDRRPPDRDNRRRERGGGWFPWNW